MNNRNCVVKVNSRSKLQTITSAMNTLTPSVPLEKPENQVKLDYIQSVASVSDFVYTPEFYDNTEALWKDRGVQQTFERSSEYQLINCAK